MLAVWKAVVVLALIPIFRAPAAFAPRHTAVDTACWGDVNGDTRVDVADAHLIARYAIGMRLVHRKAVEERGDVTGDGRVNVSDAQQVARHSVGLLAVRRLRAPCNR